MPELKVLNPPSDWKPNESLREGIEKVASRELGRLELLKRIKVAKALYIPRYRFALEAILTDMALSEGTIAPTAENVKVFSVEGEQIPIFVGNWITDLLDWLIANGPAIIELIMTIVSLFASGQIDYKTATTLIAYALAGAELARQMFA